VHTRKRLEMITNAGLPPLRVVRLSTLIELGRIPRSTEGHAVDALQEFDRLGELAKASYAQKAASDPDFPDARDLRNLLFPLLVFFSHRWVRPIEGFPDGPDNAKARALIHWAKQELWEQRKKTEVLVRFVLTTWNREVERGDIWKMVVAKVSLLIYLVIVLVAWAVGDWGVCWYIILVILVMGALMNVGARNEVCRKAATKLTGHHAREVEDEVASFIALLPTEVLFFIDYTCVDQENPSAEVGAIPAYVSSCSEILTHFDEMYAQRAWCRAEMMLAYAFTGELDRETFQKKVHMMEFEERKRADEEALERGVLCPVNQCSSNCSHMCMI